MKYSEWACVFDIRSKSPFQKAGSSFRIGGTGHDKAIKFSL